MTEAKSTQPQVKPFLDRTPNEMHAAGESTQPQLPPRPTLRATRDTWNEPIIDAYLASEADAFIAALEAENESLKAQLAGVRDVLRESAWNHGSMHEDDCPADDTCGCKWYSFNARINAACGEIVPHDLSFMARANRVEAERGKMLEVIREYIGKHYCVLYEGHGGCSTCIKADAVLPKEAK